MNVKCLISRELIVKFTFIGKFIDVLKTYILYSFNVTLLKFICSSAVDNHHVWGDICCWDVIESLNWSSLSSIDLKAPGEDYFNVIIADSGKSND